MSTLGFIWNTLRHRDAIKRGYVEVPARRFRSAIARALSDHPGLDAAEVHFHRNHVVLELTISKSVLRYKWLGSFALRGAHLNRADRTVEFQAGLSRVAPANFAAKSVRFLPSLIPGVGLLLGIVIRKLLDVVVDELLDDHANTAIGQLATRRTNQGITVSLGSLERHQLFRPYELPVVGTVPLVGGIVLARKLTFDSDRVRLDIEINPELRRAMEGAVGAVGDATQLPDFDWQGAGQGALRVLIDETPAPEMPAAGGTEASDMGRRLGGIVRRAANKAREAAERESSAESAWAAAKSELLDQRESLLAPVTERLQHEIGERTEIVAVAVGDIESAINLDPDAFAEVLAMDPEWAVELATAPLIDPVDFYDHTLDAFELLMDWW